MTKDEKEERRRLWKERINSYLSSGQSVRAWCMNNDLKEHQFRYWLDKYTSTEKEVSASKWISVEVEKKHVTEDNVLSIKIGQAIIDVKSGFDPKLLREVVTALDPT